jgi:hypothetical protein
LLILNFSKDYLNNIIGNFEDEYITLCITFDYNKKKWSELITRGITSIMKLIIDGSNNQRKRKNLQWEEIHPYFLLRF